MALPVLAICDTDLEYLDRLYESMMQKKDFIFTIRLYTGVERLMGESVDDIAVLLVDQSLHNKILENIPLHSYLILGKTKDLEDNVNYLYKYCKTDRLIQQIYEKYYESSNCIVTKRNHNTQIIGFYSPIKRCYQTSLALTLGQLLAQQTSVLYFNLEGFNGSSIFFEEHHPYEITDILYLLKNVPDKLPLKLSSMIEHINGLEYLPPCESDLDIRKMNVEDVLELIEVLVVEKSYAYIFLDLSDCLPNMHELLQICDKIYTIQAKDAVGLSKLKGYEETIAGMNYHSILEKTKKIHIPTFSNMPCQASKLLYSELAEYAKELQKEDFNDAVSSN